MEKFNEIYRIQSIRLKNWNYQSSAVYFITICTENHNNYFGEINKGSVVLNELGNIAKEEWLKTSEIRKDMNLGLGEFIVMPNHFHGIVIIGQNDFNENLTEQETKFGKQSKNLASIIRGFKSAVTVFAKKNQLEFKWQSRFYEHIIRDVNEYHNISEYIKNNPMNWEIKNNH